MSLLKNALKRKKNSHRRAILMSRSALGFDLKACADLRKVKENLTIVFSKFIDYFYKKNQSPPYCCLHPRLNLNTKSLSGTYGH